MTRKEIEKRCREEMQQNIPDKEALWNRIESSLPEPNPSAPESTAARPVIRMHTLYRVMAGAACFLFVLAGASLFRMQRLQTAAPENAPAVSDNAFQNADDFADADAAADEAENTVDETAPPLRYAEPKAGTSASSADSQEMLQYSDLNVSQFREAGDIDTTLLSTDGQYFQQDDVLAETQVFADVTILEHTYQNPKTGEVWYTALLTEVYGDNSAILEMTREDATFFIVTNSPYLLYDGHEYVLPLYLYSSGKEWRIAGDCAPPIELTYDRQVLFHNGWYSLVSEEAEPVLYDSVGSDDFFYDRMYLTGYSTLQSFLEDFQEEVSHRA